MVQPIVPLRSATTRSCMPAFSNDWVPMMLRVRPAQWTTTVVSGRGAMARRRWTSSAPGTLTEPGIVIVRCSAKVRASSTTRASSPSWSEASSTAEIDGVPTVTSTSSPKALLGALTSVNSSPPLLAHPSTPPSRARTSTKPRRWRTAVAREASFAVSATTAIGTVDRGRQIGASISNLSRGTEAANNGWPVAWRASARTSSRAISRFALRASRTSSALTVGTVAALTSAAPRSLVAGCWRTRTRTVCAHRWGHTWTASPRRYRLRTRGCSRRPGPRRRC